MNPELFEIARTKTTDKKEQKIIEELLFLYRGIYGLSMLMPSLITACKVMRGEKPQKYSKQKQKDIDSYDEDALKMEKEAIENAKSAETAVAILGPIYYGYKCNIDYDIDFLRFFKKGELDVAEVIISLQKTFIEKMEAYLSQYGGDSFLKDVEIYFKIKDRSSNKSLKANPD